MNNLGFAVLEELKMMKNIIVIVRLADWCDP